MKYEYTCPGCGMVFSSEAKNGIVTCSHCEEILEAVNGEKVYFPSEDYDDAGDYGYDDEDEDDDDDEEEDE